MGTDEQLKKIEETLKNRATTNMLSEMRKDLELKIDEILESIDKKYNINAGEIAEIKEEIEKIKSNIVRLENESANIKYSVESLNKYFLKYEKLRKKLKNLEEIMGVEEEIDVNKIPPSILRLVYQYTLNDAIITLRKYVGPNDAERIIEDVLTNVRTKTSGTELFKLKNGKIEARDIEIAIKKKLISPKQIHLTYIEIINSIKEFLPGYIPKNFASLLRTKGQEYAIENTTENRLRIEMIERNVKNLQGNMAYMENALREDISETKKLIEMDIEEKSREHLEKMEKLSNEISTIKDEIEKIYSIIDSITPYMIFLHNDVHERLKNDIPPEGIDKNDLQYPEKIVENFIEEEVNKGNIILKDNKIYVVSKVKKEILKAVGDDGASLSKIIKMTGYEKELLLTVLEWMKNDKILEEKKYGKGRKYKRR